jgi:hypothetical protein
LFLFKILKKKKKKKKKKNAAASLPQTNRRKRRKVKRDNDNDDVSVSTTTSDQSQTDDFISSSNSDDDTKPKKIIKTHHVITNSDSEIIVMTSDDETAATAAQTTLVKRKSSRITKRPITFQNFDTSSPSVIQTAPVEAKTSIVTEQPAITTVVVNKAKQQFARKSTAPFLSNQQQNPVKSLITPVLPKVVVVVNGGGGGGGPTAITNSSDTTTTTTTTTPLKFKNKMVSCKPFCQSKAVECVPSVRHASTQVDLDEIKLTHTIVPVPVPLSVPVPLFMFQAAMPVPIFLPVPIPIPVFIPTTKNTFERVQRRIKKLRQKLPADPYEFEILLYAERLAREEGLAGFEDSSDGSESDTAEPPHHSQETNLLKEQQQQQQQQEEGSFKWILGVRMFNSWLIATNTTNEDDKMKSSDLLKLKNDQLNLVLARFLHEVRKPTGEVYAPESLYYLCLGIQHFLQEKDRIENIFLDFSLFNAFQEALNDIALKYQIRINSDGQIISRIDEEILWESKQLGAFSPFVLLNTILFFNTKYFFLDKINSHMQLSFANVKKHSKRNIGPNGEEYGKTVFLRYYPDFHGLVEQVIYEQGENYDNPLRCPVELYNFYLSKCPESVKNRSDVFYLLPERASLPSSPVWFSSQPVSAKVLERMLNRIKMVKEVNELLIAAAPPPPPLPQSQIK